MARIRAFENAAEEASRGSVAAFGATANTTALVRGPLHLSTGQEAVAAGVCANLLRSDCLTSTHRGHGHTLAKGADASAMMCELFGRADGTNKGKGGSMHIADFAVGMLGANGVVAAGIPIAVGAAHSAKIRGSSAIVACFFGDGAINRGPFLEGLNWARIFDLPILFVCEDNRYSATTATDAMTAGAGAAARARGIGLPAETVDGNDVIAVDDAARELVARIRAGNGPQFMHALTYRIKGHVSVDAAAYRDQGEVEQAIESDPLKLAGSRLAALGVPAERIAEVDAEAQAEIQAALAAAHAARVPDPDEAYADVQDTGAGQWR
ncbi:MAG: thiamine pyrophosphate-dependent dehydrogenase E1 component subunit alpha [Betaproteobacteria bacterium]|nr:MAG: thiamine pyrophosphate-dependent dehydrogenase E1 component subunit alpha [Betaproteobacteria bacterium]